MAVLGGTVLTLADITARQDPNGMPAMIAEQLHQAAPILDDIPWVQGNLMTGHRSAIRTGIPAPTKRRLNTGVASTKSTVSQVMDSLTLLEAHSEVDVKLLEIAGDPGAYRRQEAAAIVEGFAQEVTRQLIYGDPALDELEFQGLKPRFNTLGTQVISGGSGDADVQSSIYLVGWGTNTVFGIYPKNTVAGLQHHDMGEQLVPTATTSAIGTAKMRAFVDVFTWDCGLVVKDPRYVVRIANVRASEALSMTEEQELTDYGTNMLFQMLEATHRLHNRNNCKPVFYMPRSLVIAFDKQSLARTSANVYLYNQLTNTPETGLAFRGIPIKALDQMIYTEAVVS